MSNQKIKKVVCPGCGQVFERPKQLSGHLSGCEGYNGELSRKPKVIKEYDLDGNLYYKCPGCGYITYNQKAIGPHTGKCKGYLSEDKYLKVCENQKNYARRPKPGRSKAFAEGRLTPTHGNQFKSSYLREYYLRSSYEAIYAAWLLYNNIKFDYECYSFYYTDTDNTYTPDFYIPGKNLLVEVKGRSTKSNLNLFEELVLVNGFNYELIYGDEIWEYYHDVEVTDKVTKFCNLYRLIMESTPDNRVRWDYIDGRFIIIDNNEGLS